ncbi:MAG: prephenate dehydratase [Inconstantimicrobium porci]|uniref:prephenate dehydratase n=1 Tax=Inconstantimicrobium porci TaxID=2652291 RepID=UPI002A91E47A|nr:prephenate dehydratase [Inconstantimicrobium porci]MDY5911640.1 prephenate dehydratase [Inconstantimicrobium porci]
MGLDEYRKKIDDIDKQMMKLFADRMETVTKVGLYKKQHNIEILNTCRENQVIEKNVKLLDDSLKEEGKEFLEAMMAVSRKYQAKIINKQNTSTYDYVKIGYPGVRGSFCHQALLEYFKTEKNAKNYNDFEDVFVSLKNGEIEYAVLPIENSSTGAINSVYDLLRKYGFYIVGEQCISIDQNLIGIDGTEITDIEEVYSHTQGFEQSSMFLQNHKMWKLIPYHNTATSAKHVKELNDKHKAAIASREAAKIYGLKVIKEGINDNRNNTTRFIIVGKKLQNDDIYNKISVVFSLKHESGSLYSVLKYFAENKINLLKIESRPREETNWEYFFYIDFEGNLNNESIDKAINELKTSSSYFRLLGCYKASCEVK